MLEKASQELHNLQGHCSQAIAARFFVFEENPAVINFNDAAVGYGHFKDVGCKVFDAFCTGADCLAVDDPGLLPDIRADFGSKPALSHFVIEFCHKDFGHGLDGQKEVNPRRMPPVIGFRQGPTGYNIVNVGVIGHLSSPRMQDTEEARQVSSDKLFIKDQLF